MKNFIFSTVAIALLSLSVQCNDDDDYPQITSTNKIKIDSVSIVNDTMNLFQVQSITTYSTYSNGCMGFYGYDYVPDSLTRNVTAYSFTQSGNCTQALYSQANQFNFQPKETGTYTFNFWTSDSTSITKTIVVE